MRDRSRGAFGLFGTAVLLLGLEAFAIHSGVTIKIVVAILLALIAVLLLANLDMYRVGLASAYSAAFTLPWNGWLVAGVRPGDGLIIVALMAFVAAGAGGTFPKLPWWVKQLAFMVLLVAILHEVVPTDPHYLAERIVVNAGGQPVTPNYHGLLSNMGAAFKFLVGVVAIPLAFGFPAMRNPRTVGWLAATYSAGAGLSGLVAFLDRVAGAGIGHLLTRFPAVSGGRQPGFSGHPNFLAAGCALAIPVALWLLFSPERRIRWLGFGVLLGNAVGIYASGSRGGVVCLVFATIVSVFVLPRARPYVLPFLLGAGALSVSVIALVPSLAQSILRTTRLGGSDTSGSASNFVRALVGDQGWRDFHHSPIDGIGFQVATEASNVYIQELASGGLLLFVALTVYMLGAMYASYKLMPQHYLAAALLVSLITAAALNYVEADLTDRFYYVPGALVVALMCATFQRERGAAADVPAAAENAAPV
jgi:hypothetical protein